MGQQNVFKMSSRPALEFTGSIIPAVAKQLA